MEKETSTATFFHARGIIIPYETMNNTTISFQERFEALKKNSRAYLYYWLIVAVVLLHFLLSIYSFVAAAKSLSMAFVIPIALVGAVMYFIFFWSLFRLTGAVMVLAALGYRAVLRAIRPASSTAS